MNHKLTFGSLFSGIGGLDIGLERCGMICKWQCEIDNYATKILEKHWSDVKRYKDIRDIKKLKYVDVIAGGFPCQDISNAGKRKGIEGERSGLWKEFHRIICLVRPKYIIVENVSALLARGMDTVLTDLSQSGYDSEWDCIPASSIGAPHRRDRVFIIAYRNKIRIREYEFLQEGYVSDSNFDRCKQMPERFINQGDPERNSMVLQEKGEEEISNTNNKRLQMRFFGADKKRTLERYCRKTRREQWETEPNVGRVAHGISNRIHRIRCLGNAVVPQLAEFIGLQILEKFKGDLNENNK